MIIMIAIDGGGVIHACHHYIGIIACMYLHDGDDVGYGYVIGCLVIISLARL